MLNSISRLGETSIGPSRNGRMERDFPVIPIFRIPKFSKTFPGMFTVPFSFGPEISVFLVEWKAPLVSHVWSRERAHLKHFHSSSVHSRNLDKKGTPPWTVFVKED